jgi:hypothetical protein
MRLACLLVLALAGAAHASPVTVVAGLGLGEAKTELTESGSPEFQLVGELQLDAGVRLTRQLSVGAHAGLSTGVSQYEFIFQGTSEFQNAQTYTYRPLQLGVSAQLQIRDRFWAAPWFGLQRGWRRADCRFTYYTPPSTKQDTKSCDANASFDFDGPSQLAFGLAAGVDVNLVEGGSAAQGGHRFTILAAATHARPVDNSFFAVAYTSIWLGVGYRFWAL